MENNEVIWAEKYRPAIVADMVLTKENRVRFEQYLASGIIPNLLFTGSAGIGKTTAAKVLCGQAGYDILFINASMEATIDTLRDRVTNFAQRISMKGIGVRKAVIMDEVDGVTSQSFFTSLRPMIEEFSKNCSFIFTANQYEKIPDPIVSRCQWFDFQISDVAEYSTGILERMFHVLKKENIAYTDDTIKKIVKKYFPDIRKTINALQQSQNFLTDPDILLRLEGIDVKKLYDAIKSRNVIGIQDLVEKDFSHVLESVYGKIYNSLRDYMTDESIPKAILLLDDAARFHNQTVNKTISVVAFLIRFASAVKFK